MPSDLSGTPGCTYDCKNCTLNCDMKDDDDEEETSSSK